MLPNTENPGAVSGAGSPNPGQGAQTGTSSSVDEATVNAILERLSPEIDKRIQSTKDKRIASMQGELNEFEKKLARLKELQEQEGYTEKQALRVMQLEDQQPSAQTQTGTPPAPSGAGTSGEKGGLAVDEGTIRAFGLEPNDPRVTEAVRTLSGSSLITRLVQLSKGGPAADIAQAPPMVGQSGGTGESVEELTAKLEQLMTAPSKNMAQIRALNAKLGAMVRR